MFDLDLNAFNPIRNYNEWNKINWFGVIIGTILLHLIYIPLAIYYWCYILVTVGRK